MNILQSQNWVQADQYRQHNGTLESLNLLTAEEKGRELAALIACSDSVNSTYCTKHFFSPSIEHLHDPYLFEDMEKACTLIAEVLTKKGKILIYGDYDADGLTSTSLLIRFFNYLGVKVDHMIPDRLADGYGLVSNRVEEICKQAYDLVITVDCGIANIEEVTTLQNQNIPVIITDHHQAKAELPPAVAIINPTVDRRYPFSGLAGVGVALKLAMGLLEHPDMQTLYPDLNSLVELPCLIVLAAIGTVADSMLLVDENRTIVTLGLSFFSQSAPRGLLTLLDERTQLVDAKSIGFYIAPRLNAAGRLCNLTPAVNLLISDDPETCSLAAKELEDLNTERKELEQYALDAAIAKIEEMAESEKRNLIVVVGEDWHAGVIGIVGTKLSYLYGASTIVFTRSGTSYRGSCRSIQGFNILAALKSVEQHILTYGGHNLAAGVEVEAEKLEAFKKDILEYADSHPTTILQQKYTFKLPASFCKAPVAQALLSLEPHGRGNEQPVFYIAGVVIKEWRTVGNGEHVAQLFELPNRSQIRGIWFKGRSFDQLYRPGDKVDILCHLKYNVWNNYGQAQLQVLAMRPPFFNSVLWDQWQDLEIGWRDGVSSRRLMQAFSISESQLMLNSVRIQAVVKYLRAFSKLVASPCDLAILTRAIIRYSSVALTPFIVKRIIDCLSEVDYLQCRLEGEQIRLSLSLPATSQSIEDTIRDTATNRRMLLEEISDIGKNV